ncbi:MAG TPA: methylenetetrahydrofolate reductase [NAD(P)H] [Thermopetrobacter sp.]|nr:methylenetetrahydrofolate reductase [NAD(P)H] [Thermopetrobacter sp.]
MSGQAHNDGIEVSFEVFPARTDTGRAALARLARRLARFKPEFISVTYGAGGSSRDLTEATIRALLAAAGIPVAAHLTAARASRADTMAAAERFVGMGVSRIVALRGDAEKGAPAFTPHPDGFANAAQLTAALRERWPDLPISVAAYPEVHPDSPSREADLDNLKAKFAAGATDAITQFFFDNRLFTDFLRDTKARGIAGSIIPGVMLIHDFAGVRQFAASCGASVPARLDAAFAGLRPKDGKEDRAVHDRLAAAIAARQTLDLAAAGVRRFHFYTMNKSAPAEAMCRILKPQI